MHKGKLLEKQKIPEAEGWSEMAVAGCWKLKMVLSCMFCVGVA